MSPPQKIGVLTFHRCINYGSYWQSRCLVEGLRARGKDAILLDHASPRINRAEWRCALQPLLPAPVQRSDYPLYAAKVRSFFNAIAALPLSPRFALENPLNMDSYDLVIVGSDEVWNLRHPWYGKHAIFFGDGLRAPRVASYAASFGNQPASQGLDRRWADKLRKFPKISIRDENSRRLIEKALGYEPELVLDPCLQFPEAVSASVASSKRKSPANHYVAIYGHTFPKWFKEQVRRWAEEQGLRLISIGYRNDWADEQWISAGPEDFAAFMAASQAVATNFFHGCVFALLNGKPFACAPSEYRVNKLRGLTELVGAERHLLSEEAPKTHYDSILREAFDPTITNRIATLRRRSAAYLDDVLN